MSTDGKRGRADKIKSNLATPEGKIFVEVVRRARGDSRALAGVAVAHEILGLPTSWMRERVNGRIRVKAIDLEILDRLVDVAKSTPYHRKLEEQFSPARGDKTTSEELRLYRLSVRKMCRECVGGESDEEAQEIGCPDGRCPLRRVSPLPMSSNPIEIPEVWE